MSKGQRLSRIALAGGIIILCAAALSLFIPNYCGSPRSPTLAMISNLRQLDGAVQQWALDHGQTGAVVATQEDVAPYLRHPLKSVVGERYIIRALSESPEARLTRKVEGWPLGSLIRLDTNDGFHVILPNEQGRANGRQPFRSETNRTSAAAASRRSP